MEYLYVICAGLLIFFSFSLLTKKNKPLSERIFSVWIIILLVTVISFFLHMKGLAYRYPVFMSLICDTHLLHGAILLLYIRAFTDNAFRIKREHLWHLSPVFLLVAGKLYLNFVTGALNCYREGGCFEDDSIFVDLTYLYKYLVLGGYILASWKVVQKYRREARLPREKMRSEWIRQISMGVTFLYFGILIIQAGKQFLPDLFWENVLLGNILATLFIFIFLYLGNSYTYIFVFPSRNRFLNLSETFSPDQCKQEEIRNEFGLIFRNLEQLMKTRQPYLKTHLTISELADQMQKNPASISQAIKYHAGSNFNEYVNHYRVERMKELLSNPSNWNYKIMSLAEEAGFSSKSTLIRIFKKETGITPGEYLQQVRDEPGSETDQAVLSNT